MLRALKLTRGKKPHPGYWYSADGRFMFVHMEHSDGWVVRANHPDGDEPLTFEQFDALGEAVAWADKNFPDGEMPAEFDGDGKVECEACNGTGMKGEWTEEDEKDEEFNSDCDECGGEGET